MNTYQLSESRDRQFRSVDTARSAMTDAQRSLYDAEKMRYRYVLGDASKKIADSQIAFKELYKKTYSPAEVQSQYLNSMDTLGMFMTKIQTGGVITEAAYRKEILAIGKSLTAEEKILFLGMV